MQKQLTLLGFHLMFIQQHANCCTSCRWNLKRAIHRTKRHNRPSSVRTAVPRCTSSRRCRASCRYGRPLVCGGRHEHNGDYDPATCCRSGPASCGFVSSGNHGATTPVCKRLIQVNERVFDHPNNLLRLLSGQTAHSTSSANRLIPIACTLI